MDLDKVIDNCMMNFGTSEPGAWISYLYVVTTEADKTDPMICVGAIAPQSPNEDAGLMESFIKQQKEEARKKNRLVSYVMMILETTILTVDVRSSEDEKKIDDVGLLLQQHRLHEHKESCEVTLMYAACTDGRRWFGKHDLTGPTASQKLGPKLMTGPLASEEKYSRFGFIRGIVGIEETRIIGIEDI
jgi:hypothetical protein